MTDSVDRPKAPFGRRDVVVTERQWVGPYSTLRCTDAGAPRPRAGQFYMLMTAEGWGGGEDGRPYLPRALSFARVRTRDAALELEFVFENVGPGTGRLDHCRPGDRLFLSGPFGNGFATASASPSPLLVGGGVGFAPILALTDELVEADRNFAPVLLGFRSGDHARAAEFFDCEVLIATEDGDYGHRGYVTQLLGEALNDDVKRAVFACGPPPMLEAVRSLCKEREVSCQLAMESGMACGFGACFGCVVPTKSGFVRLCVDGPVLDASELDTALATGAVH